MQPVSPLCSSPNVIACPAKSKNRISEIVRRILSSTLFWTAAGTAALIIGAITLFSGGSARLPMALGVLMLTPAIMNVKRLVYEASMINTVMGHLLCHKPWYDEILPGKLTLGAIPLVNYNHVDELKAIGVNTVLTTLEPHEWNQSNLFGTPAKGQDWKEVDIDHHLIESPDFLPLSQESIKQGVSLLKQEIESKRHIYVHCKAGRGRSATIVVCYLLQENRGLRVDQAIAMVKQKRNVISINAKQKQAIVEYSQSLDRARKKLDQVYSHEQLD